MSLLSILIVFLIIYFSTKLNLKFLNGLFPGASDIETVIEQMMVFEEEVEISNIDKFVMDYSLNIIKIAIHTEPIAAFYGDCYNNPNKYKDCYSYFRYDFISGNRCVLKLTILVIIFFTPVAIYESSEYGFPKEYFYFIPILVYSTFMTYLATIFYQDFENLVKNSGFFKENLNIPEIYEGEAYIYLSDMESYLLNRIKKFYYYISTESINIPIREPGEEYVMEGPYEYSVIKRFFKFIRPILPNPNGPPKGGKDMFGKRKK